MEMDENLLIKEFIFIAYYKESLHLAKWDC